MKKRSEFVEFLKSILSVEARESERTMIIQVMPDLQVAVKKSMLTPENKTKFVEAMKKIPNIHKGMSYMMMAGQKELEMDENIAKVCMGVGRAFKVWSLVPMDTEEEHIRKAYLDQDKDINMLPMNSGLVPRGIEV